MARGVPSRGNPVRRGGPSPRSKSTIVTFRFSNIRLILLGSNEAGTPKAPSAPGAGPQKLPASSEEEEEPETEPETDLGQPDEVAGGQVFGLGAKISRLEVF